MSAAVVALELDRIEADQREWFVLKVVPVIATLHESFPGFNTIKSFGLLAYWEPNVKQFRVVSIGNYFIARHVVVDNDIIVSNARQ